MTDQTPSYEPGPVTQRDGSPLASSNCRLAAAATGLDYDTRGRKTSTGAKMRSYTSDQSGGTSSADAVEAWQRGYSEELTVRDGRLFDEALADLRAGHLVHLDVWAATGGSPCVSGSGAYGHTVAVLPESAGGSWKVSDPWCLPARWIYVPEQKLRAGAEEWGRRVLSTAGDEADWPTGGGWPRLEDPDDRRWAILRRVVAALMERYHAGGDDDPRPDPGETGGTQRIFFTRTKAQPLEDDDVAGVQLTMVESYDGTAVVQGAGHSWIRVWDGALGAAPAGFTKPVFAKAKLKVPFETPGPSPAIPAGTKVVLIGDDCAFFLEQDVKLTPAAPPVGDCSEAIAKRDIEWEDWLLEGAPGQD